MDKRAEVQGGELGPIEEHEEEDEQGGEVRDRGREAEFWRDGGLPSQQDRLLPLKRLDLPLLRVGVWHACCGELHVLLQIMLATSRPNLRRGRGQDEQRRHLCEQ